MVQVFKKGIILMAEKSIYAPNVDALNKFEWKEIIETFNLDYLRYYSSKLDFDNIKYFPGLLATLFYRISRRLFLAGKEKDALEFSSLGFFLTSIELYYSSEIGKSFKINHGAGTVVGSRTYIGESVTLHHNITIGEKNQGRAKIMSNVIIYPGAIVVGDVTIGESSIVGANVFIDKSYSNNSIIVK